MKAEVDHDRISAAFHKRWADEIGICQAIGKELPTEADRVLGARLYVQGWFDADTKRIAELEGLLAEALPNLADYVIMAADQPDSLWFRIHNAITRKKDANR